MRLRMTFDVIVPDDTYLEKADWEYLQDQVVTVIKEVAFPTQGITPEDVEFADKHVHRSTPSSNCSTEYELAEDGKN